MAQLPDTVELLSHTSAKLNIHLSNIPLAPCCIGNIIGQLETQLCLAWNSQSICQIVTIRRLVEIISVGAEQIGNAVTFFVERGNIKWVATMYFGIIKCLTDEGIATQGESEI